MTTCATWSQPDGNHFRGLCRNEFYRETNPGIVGSSCPICVTPVGPFPECDELPRTRHICRKWDGTTIGPGGIRPDQYIDTWVPFYTVNLNIPPTWTSGNAPWYSFTGFTTCDRFYLGEFTLGTIGGRCGSWETFLTDPNERYALNVGQFNPLCDDYTPLPRIQLFWSETNPVIGSNPVMTLRINFRVAGTVYRINCRYSNSPLSPIQHDCRVPLSFQTWQNTAGWNHNGSTSFAPISAMIGCSVTLTPLYL